VRKRCYVADCGTRLGMLSKGTAGQGSERATCDSLARLASYNIAVNSCAAALAHA
jgi:hypothetical protein